VEHLDGILITHEHSDHCSGLPQMLGIWKAPLYVTEPTMDALQRTLPDTFGKRLRGMETIQAGQRFTIGDIDVHAFAIPHDAADPIGFTFKSNGANIRAGHGSGIFAGTCESAFEGCGLSAARIKSRSGYAESWSVSVGGKQRVLSRTGHLSNLAVSDYLADPEGFDARARYLVLAHISQENNNPDVVRISAEQALRQRPAECAFNGELLLASQQTPLQPLEL